MSNSSLFKDSLIFWQSKHVKIFSIWIYEKIYLTWPLQWWYSQILLPDSVVLQLSCWYFYQTGFLLRKERYPDFWVEGYNLEINFYVYKGLKSFLTFLALRVRKILCRFIYTNMMFKFEAQNQPNQHQEISLPWLWITLSKQSKLCSDCWMLLDKCWYLLLINHKLKVKGERR